jgi:hypothetical protein
MPSAVSPLAGRPRPRRCPHRPRPGARRPRDGDAVRRTVSLVARAAARRSATCGTVRRPTGPRTGTGTGTGPCSLRRPGAVAAAGPPPRRGVAAGGAPRPGRDGGRPGGHRARTATSASGESAAAPPGLSSMDTQHGAPICRLFTYGYP